MYSCRQYHFETSYRRYGMQPHRLDWVHQPELFKQYPAGEELPLPEPGAEPPKMSLWEAVAAPAAPRTADAVTRRDLARMLSLAYRLTARSRHPGGVFYYRSVASAGALYPTELYVSVGASPDLPTGVYHYDIARFRLTRLRAESPVRQIAALVPAWRESPPSAAFFISGIFFRSAWKYRQRAYRYVLLDAGHLLANLVLAPKALGFAGLPASDFDDAGINALIGVDGRREVCLACCAIPGPVEKAPSGQPELTPLPDDRIGASRVSAAEIVYPEMEKIHAAGCTVQAQHEATGEMRSELGVSPSAWQPFETGRADSRELDFAAAVIKRRSRRNYVREALPREQFGRLLDLVWLAQRHDLTGHPTATALAVGFLAGNVQGLAAGFYLLDGARRRFGLVEEGGLVEKMAAVCLDQQWLSQAAVHVLFMANLDCLDRWFGPRGYRHAMLCAGCLGQVVYLGATAMGLGACGIGALYDDEAQALLGLNEQSVLLYLVAAGPVKR